MMIVYYIRSATEFNYMLPILKKTGGILVVDTTYSKSLNDYVVSRYPAVNCRQDKMRNLLIYHPDVIVFAGNYRWVPKKGKLVQLFHGLVDKNSEFSKAHFKNNHNPLWVISFVIQKYFPICFRKFSLLNNELWEPFKILELDKLIENRYDLMCLVGKHMEEKFREMDVLSDSNWKRIGMPRLDCVANNELSREEIFKDLNIDPKLKTILYAPTWRGIQKVNLSSIPDMGIKICKSVGDNFNFIFKPHPNVEAYDEFPEAMKKIERYIKTHQNSVFPDSSTDIIPLMHISDVLITDFSTVGIEYLAFDKPILFADHLDDKYNDPNLVEVWIREAGEIIMDPREFKKMIKTCLDNPSEKSEIRRKLRDYFFYSLDGKATERAAKVILDLEKQ